MIDIKQPYIQVDSINKSFGRSRVLHDISFSVMQNQVTIIRGMNGSGKSTLLSILSTHISPDSGTVFYKGLDSKKNLHNIRNSLGILDHLPMLYERLTVKENLQFFAKVYSISNVRDEIDFWVDKLEISKYLDQQIHNLSHGFRKRVGLARALIHSPQVLLLDEPETGLDQKSLEIFFSILSEFVGSDGCVVLTTHNDFKALEKFSQNFLLEDNRLIHQ